MQHPHKDLRTGNTPAQTNLVRRDFGSEELTVDLATRDVAAAMPLLHSARAYGWLRVHIIDASSH